ncbi:hypothetical protein WJX81_008387 [Elliptochloris bilobata]|uniref:Nucleolar 27S pre-rRNA processing Urb2/Npa2 C-terminal domain-containing protein n=1 Tax=Elliptochloris bilobata TaxID=381761 RepID=A0AAW1RUX2_9CHLO
MDVPAEAGANPALVEAAAHACGLLRGSCSGAVAAAAAEALAAAVLRALRVLSAKFGRTCRPSLEHSVALAEAALAAVPAPALATPADGAAEGGPAPRAGGRVAASAAAAAAAAESRLAAAALALVEAAVLAPAHVPELAGLCAAEAAAGAGEPPGCALVSGSPGKDVAGGDMETDGKGGTGGARRGALAPRSYHWQLFQVLADEVARGSPDTLVPVLRALPWLLARFCAALRRIRPQLVAALCTTGAYRPTEDASGAQRALLRRLADAALAPFGAATDAPPPAARPADMPAAKRARKAAPEAHGLAHEPVSLAPASAPKAGGRGVAGAPGAAAAAARVAAAVMDAEPRALAARLDALWALLWAAAGDGGQGAAVAAAVAARLVRAYAELRRLQELLVSLAAALAAPGYPPAAARVAGSAELTAALRQAVHNLPPGQAPALVRWVAAELAQLARAGDGERVLGTLLATCLEASRVELTTAVAMAAAVQGLVQDALAAPLQRELLLVAKRGGKAAASVGGISAGSARLAALLRLYAAALAAHARMAVLEERVLRLRCTCALGAADAANRAASPAGDVDLASSAQAELRELSGALLSGLEDLAQLSSWAAVEELFEATGGALRALAARGLQLQPTAALADAATLAEGAVGEGGEGQAGVQLLAGPPWRQAPAPDPTLMAACTARLEAVAAAGMRSLPATLAAPLQAESDPEKGFRSPASAAFEALLALHLRLLRALLPPPEAPAPNRYAAALVMGLPTLADAARDPVRAGPCAALRRALLASACALLAGASAADAAALYAALPDVLASAESLSAALPMLEVTLVALECAPGGLRLLARHSTPLAVALLRLLERSALPLPQAGPQPGRRCGKAGAAAAAVCTALRALESLAARDAALPLPATVVAGALHCPALLFGIGGGVGGGSWRNAGQQPDPAVEAGALAGGAALLAALLRRRAAPARRLMALAAASARALLAALVAWGARSDAAAHAVACAEELARVYAAVAAHKETLGVYCPHLLADYITLAAAPAAPEAAMGDRGAAGADVAGGSGLGLGPAAAMALRQGAYELYGACSPIEVQHVFTVLGASGGGSARRTALAELRRDYERHHKHGGKV